MIKNIILDVGNILLPIYLKKSVNEFKLLGAENFERFFSLKSQAFLVNDFETGKINKLTFRKGLRNHFKLSSTDTEINLAWNAMIGDIPNPVIKTLKYIKERYNVFLYSNTNPIHFDHIKYKLWMLYSLQLHDLCDKYYLSFLLGNRKPDHKGFLTILSENKLKSHETVFIDDIKSNCNAATDVGIVSVHTPPMPNLEFIINNCVATT